MDDVHACTSVANAEDVRVTGGKDFRCRQEK